MGVWKKICWIMTAVIVTFGAWIWAQPGFAPDNVYVFNTYLFLIAMITIGKMVYAIPLLVGIAIGKRALKRGHYTGIVLMCMVWLIVVYGSTLGFSRLEVKHITYESSVLPQAFDGYKIVHFSDAHIGSFRGRKSLLKKSVDAINAQHADLVAFTGDLQNMSYDEIEPHKHVLSSISARDGVVSVLGNHDYADYLGTLSPKEKSEYEENTRNVEREMGWRLLLNEHIVIRRGADSIVVAGMENDGDGRHFKRKGNIDKTLKGVDREQFVVMLEHDPTSWQRTILPDSRSHLTLSGHTHAMQLMIFGWSPSSLMYDEWAGLFTRNGRSIYVSKGWGAFIPFRIGASREIVVITLKRQK